MSNRKIGVLFTSGLDSTYLVWKNLEEGNDVYLLYVNFDNNREKTTIEKIQAEKLYRLFANIYGNERVNLVPDIATISVSITHNSDLSQPLVWIFAMLFIQAVDYDELQLAYVMNDCAVSYLDDIKRIYNSYESFIPYNTQYKKKMIPLTFPLTKHVKDCMVDELPMIYREFVYSCEAGETGAIRPCGICRPCRKYKELATTRNAMADYKMLYDKGDGRQFSVSAPVDNRHNARVGKIYAKQQHTY